MGWPKIAVVSGGFDPIHVGHIRLLKEASKYGSEVWVILNNDAWLLAKKGFVFMPQEERKEVLESIKHVTQVVLSQHQPPVIDMSICNELEKVAFYVHEFDFGMVFCNGGDRMLENTPEYAVCKKHGIDMIFGVGGDKIQSSSELVERAKGSQRLTLEL